MTPVNCPAHGKQPGRWACDHLDALVGDADVGGIALFSFEVACSDGTFGPAGHTFRVLVCTACAMRLEMAGIARSAKTMDEAFSLLERADNVARYTVTCSKCIRELLDRSPNPVLVP